MSEIAIQRRGLMLVLSSPSGAGKTTLSRLLLEEDENITMSVSVTTRPPREGEVDGKDYYFKSTEEFGLMRNRGELLEHAKVFDNYYGTPSAPVDVALNEGRDVLFDIDWQGTEKIKEKQLKYQLITFFILPPSKKVLFERLSNRDMKDKLIVEERMKQFNKDILHWKNYDFVVINDNLEKCYNEVSNLIESKINKTNNTYDVQLIERHINQLIT